MKETERIQKDEMYFRNEIWPHYSFVKGLMYTLTLDKLLAEDLTQEAMFLCWTQMETIKTYTNIKTALTAVARNVYNQYKDCDSSKIEELAGLEKLCWLSGRSNAAGYIDREGGIHNLLFLFTDINPEYIQVILLTDYYGFSLKEVAKLVQRNYNTVISQHARGLAAIRKNMLKKFNRKLAELE